MVRWICPECGSDWPVNEKDCPACCGREPCSEPEAPNAREAEVAGERVFVESQPVQYAEPELDLAENEPGFCSSGLVALEESVRGRTAETPSEGAALPAEARVEQGEPVAAAVYGGVRVIPGWVVSLVLAVALMAGLTLLVYLLVGVKKLNERPPEAVQRSAEIRGGSMVAQSAPSSSAIACCRNLNIPNS